MNIDKLLAPIAGDNPTGDDLEYDAEFTELARSARGKPEHVMGDEVRAAEEPEWAEVESKAEQLLSRTKDLRVAVHLTHAALVRHGIVGLADGLSLTRQLLDGYWDGIHPRLDPADDNDPTLRVNCLLPLADREGLVAKLRTTPIVSSQQLGRFSYRDFQIAKGEIRGPDGAVPPDMSQIDGAFQDAHVEDLSETNTALEGALASAVAINAGISERVGASYAPNFDPLLETLKGIRSLIAERLIQRGVGTPGADATGNVGASATPRTSPGEIATREDVIAALERICDYYKRHEQSSPVPIVLRRAQRLARMDFMEILRDMAPSGVAEAELIGGVQAKE